MRTVIDSGGYLCITIPTICWPKVQPISILMMTKSWTYMTTNIYFRVYKFQVLFKFVSSSSRDTGAKSVDTFEDMKINMDTM